LVSDVEGGTTGLSEAVEDAMWDRQAERDSQAFADARERIMSAWGGATGFELPDNTLAALISDQATKEAYRQLDRSRDITVESFKLAVENRKFAITQGIVLESALMQHFNNVYERALRYTVARVETGIKLFLGVIDGYKANAEAKLADVRLQVEENKGQIDIYLGKLSKLKSEAEIAALKVEAVMRKYGVEMQGYTAEIGLAEGQARINVEVQKMALENYIAAMNADLTNAKLNLEAWQQKASLKTHAATAGGQIYANYIASAVNSLNAVMHMSSSYEEQGT
jgi:hypothetical protein